MLFNSLQFGIFFIIVYSFYLVLNHKWQNRMLLAASCIFYGSWNWKFLFLMFTSITTDYFCGLKIDESKNEETRKQYLFFSILVNLLILGFFKYYNFFIENFKNLLSVFGIIAHPHSLNIILPLGISFYTFQTMSYAIDVYRKEIKPTKNFFDYALFVSYFPHLMAGPIMRAKQLLAQVINHRKITLNTFYEGCYLIFWGLFQKVFVADNLAKIVDPIFASAPPYNGAVVLVAMYAFVFQIFCDFSGYSDMARGLGKVMGFEIMINFNTPFLVTNVQEFWQKWHISLSTWVRDYLYMPLFTSLRKIKGNPRVYIAVIVTMTLLGLWHGAGWTFVVFGLYYGILLVAYTILRARCHSWIVPKSTVGQKIWLWVRIIFMFHITAIGLMIFRARSIAQMFDILYSLILNFQFSHEIPLVSIIGKVIFYTNLVIIVQIFQFIKKDLMAILKINTLVRAAFYIICFYGLALWGSSSGKEFIYFQF